MFRSSMTTKIISFLLIFFDSVIGFSQTIENVTFSSVASMNDNFQPVMGTPYGASLSGANGSLEISSSYGDATYNESTLSTTETIIHSNIRIFPNPTSYKINVDFGLLPNDEYHLNLYDLSGKIFLSQVVSTSKTEMDLMNIPNGSYLLMVNCKDSRKTETFKISKIK